MQVDKNLEKLYEAMYGQEFNRTLLTGSMKKGFSTFSIHNIDELKAFKSVYNYRSNTNSEKIAARLLFDITRNTGFETDKSKIGPCFVCSCCEWDGKQDDICGLDNSKPTLSEKMKQLSEYSVLHKAFEEAGL